MCYECKTLSRPSNDTETKDNPTYLFQSLAGEMSLGHDQAVALRGQVPHLTVCGPVMECHCCQVVKCFVQVMRDVGCIKNTTM